MQHKDYITSKNPLSDEPDFIFHTLNGACGCVDKYSKFYHMILVTQGKGKLECDLKHYDFQAPSLMFFRPYQAFIIYQHDHMNGRVIQFTDASGGAFSNTHAFDETRSGGNERSLPVIHLAENEFRYSESLFENIEHELEWFSPPDRNVIFSHLNTMLLHCSRLLTLSALKKKIPSDEVAVAEEYAVIKELKMLIAMHFRSHKRPKQYADMLHVSYSTLKRNVKRYMNTTVRNMVQAHIVSEARKELLVSKKPLKKIAFDLGFKDQFYFSRFFKRTVGVSPEAYRNSLLHYYSSKRKTH